MILQKPHILLETGKVILRGKLYHIHHKKEKNIEHKFKQNIRELEESTEMELRKLKLEYNDLINEKNSIPTSKTGRKTLNIIINLENSLQTS